MQPRRGLPKQPPDHNPPSIRHYVRSNPVPSRAVHPSPTRRAMLAQADSVDVGLPRGDFVCCSGRATGLEPATHGFGDRPASKHLEGLPARPAPAPTTTDPTTHSQPGHLSPASRTFVTAPLAESTVVPDQNGRSTLAYRRPFPTRRKRLDKDRGAARKPAGDLSEGDQLGDRDLRAGRRSRPAEGRLTRPV
jgi:hypothetical protein